MLPCDFAFIRSDMISPNFVAGPPEDWWVGSILSVCLPLNGSANFAGELREILAYSFGFAHFHNTAVMNHDNDGTVADFLDGGGCFLQQVALARRELESWFGC